MTTKRCTRCNRTQPLSQFRRRAPGGRMANQRMSWCRSCEREDWDIRTSGGRPIADLLADDPGERIFVCQCRTAVVDRTNFRACADCGYPIVAAMMPRQQAVMDEKWPEWRTQTVTDPALQEASA